MTSKQSIEDQKALLSDISDIKTIILEGVKSADSLELARKALSDSCEKIMILEASQIEALKKMQDKSNGGKS